MQSLASSKNKKILLIFDKFKDTLSAG